MQHNRTIGQMIVSSLKLTLFMFKSPILMITWDEVTNHCIDYPGFDFPRGTGAYAPRFCCGPPRFFRAQNSMYNNPEILLLTTYFH